MMKKITETLAGRLVIHELMPFSQKEIRNKEAFFMDKLRDNPQDLPVEKNIGRKDIENAIIAGGYPERIKLSKNIFNIRKWTDSYMETYIERDVRDINEIKNLNAFVRLYNLLSYQSGSIVIKQNLAIDVKLSIPTITAYLEILSQIYQIYWLGCWFPNNSSKQFIKSPKLFFTDSGILSHCLQIDTVKDLEKSRQRGHIVETFVLSELRKAINNSGFSGKNIYYMRTKDGKEVDFIIEGNMMQKLLAIEVKASETIHSDDFKHIRFLQKENRQLNFQGIVFYFGNEIIPFGENCTAVPLSVFF
jgi:predicted AAA+ superfamily ATPase